MLYYSIGKRLTDLHKPDICIFGHENYPWEKMFVLGMRSAAHTFIIGYQHSVLYQAFTTVLLSHNEKDIIPLPDRIVTIGGITKEYLETKGNYNPAILRRGCSLSATKSNITIKGRPKGNNLLVVLGCYPRAKVMLDFVVSSLKDSGFHLILRSHPASPLREYSNRLAFDLSSASEVEVSTNTLEKDLERSIAVLYDGSKVALEAMRAGLPVININSFYDVFSYDPLINWDTFKWNAMSKESLLDSLNIIISMTEKEYYNQRNKAIRYSIEYLGAKNSDYLDAFID
jgi:hypothetical protein